MRFNKIKQQLNKRNISYAYSEIAATAQQQ